MTMRRMMRFGWVGALVLLTGLAAGDLAAQDRRGPPQRQQMERQLRERFQQMMVQRLQLTEDQQFAMRQITEELEDSRRQLAVREARLQGELRALGDDLEEDRAQELLDEILSIKTEEAELVLLEIDRLRDVLQARQILGFIMVREEMGRRIREIRSRRGGGGDGTPSPRRPFGQSPGGPGGGDRPIG